MGEWRLFPEGTIPECTTPAWYAERDRAPHLDEPVHQGRLHLAAEMIGSVAGQHALATVVDLGAGDGGLLSLLDRSVTYQFIGWGYDLQPTNIAGAAERGVHVELGNVLTDDIAWADIAVATEMLEHLIDPHGFVASIPPEVQAVVASSPWGETGSSHYEFHLWAWDRDGYRALFEGAGWTVVDHRAAGPFQVLAAGRS